MIFFHNPEAFPSNIFKTTRRYSIKTGYIKSTGTTAEFENAIWTFIATIKTVLVAIAHSG